MVLRREAIEERLKELDRILQELNKYKGLGREAFDVDLSQQWVIERGLIAAASVILDVADHILAGHFGFYSETYEDSLKGLRDRDVISAALYRQIKGLGGFRNILVHRYLDIDPDEVVQNLKKGLKVFPRFAAQVLSWLDTAAVK
jgi:uncharacterized protein YutE (UPF0331/DUF86 family)